MPLKRQHVPACDLRIDRHVAPDSPVPRPPDLSHLSHTDARDDLGDQVSTGCEIHGVARICGNYRTSAPSKLSRDFLCTELLKSRRPPRRTARGRTDASGKIRDARSGDRGASPPPRCSRTQRKGPRGWIRQVGQVRQDLQAHGGEGRPSGPPIATSASISFSRAARRHDGGRSPARCAGSEIVFRIEEPKQVDFSFARTDGYRRNSASGVIPRVAQGESGAVHREAAGGGVGVGSWVMPAVLADSYSFWKAAQRCRTCSRRFRIRLSCCSVRMPGSCLARYG
jgi:hypothetical protein